MGSLLRSEDMYLTEMIIPGDCSYNCFAELGELKKIHFQDLTVKNKRHEKDVQRCENMLRMIRSIHANLKNNSVLDHLPEPILNQSSLNRLSDFVSVPSRAELNQIELELTVLNGELEEINKNLEILAINKTELEELVFVFENEKRSTNFRSDLDYLGSVVGVVDAKRITVFQNLVHRVCHGKVYLTISKCSADLAVFRAYFQGTQLKIKVERIAKSIHARLYTIPQLQDDRRDMQFKIYQRLEEITQVIDTTKKHHFRLLSSISVKVESLWIQIIKAKSIYYILNTGRISYLVFLKD